MKVMAFVAAVAAAAISVTNVFAAGAPPTASFIPDPHNLRVDFYNQSYDTLCGDVAAAASANCSVLVRGRWRSR